MIKDRPIAGQRKVEQSSQAQLNHDRSVVYRARAGEQGSHKARLASEKDSNLYMWGVVWQSASFVALVVMGLGRLMSGMTEKCRRDLAGTVDR